ncbi:MAG: AAA family ATPase [Lachnospiraceae bacterium]|nr:AAA family ATPase [Lachnospiraceae bacterium]
MNNRKKLLVGNEDFESIREENYYFVDKTGFIVELLENGVSATLFTRPRRFGKSLNLSMLESFFKIGARKELFEGLEVSEHADLCEKYMGQYPVISISLKDIDGNTFEQAALLLKKTMAYKTAEYEELRNSDKLGCEYQKKYRILSSIFNNPASISLPQLENSLFDLLRLLYRHYGKKVIILIDEYDVPLYRSFQNGYYDDMVKLIRGLFSAALKTNKYLAFAILTGCLQIPKESIFTGLNNLEIYSIKDNPFSQYFGFTEQEVSNALEYYGLQYRVGIVRKWYDGYRFGNTDIYCPWDVINYCNRALQGTIEPQNYWLNTSSNYLVRHLIEESNGSVKSEIEDLIAGKSFFKEMKTELTYGDMYKSVDNVWSMLFNTGYLTMNEQNELVIPNEEIRSLFISQIREWISDALKKDKQIQNEVYCAVRQGDCQTLEKACDDALNQMEEKRYDDLEEFDDVDEVMKYGIVFYRKRCKVKMG